MVWSAVGSQLATQYAFGLLRCNSWQHSMLYSLKDGTPLQDAFWFGLLRSNSWQHSWQHSMLYSMKDGTLLQDVFWFGLLRCNSWQHSWQHSMLYSMKDGTSVQDVFWFGLSRSNSWQLTQFALLLERSGITAGRVLVRSVVGSKRALRAASFLEDRTSLKGVFFFGLLRSRQTLVHFKWKDVRLLHHLVRFGL